MRPKGAGHLGPKPQLRPPEPFFCHHSLGPKSDQNPIDTLLAINPVGPIFGHGPIIQPWPLATIRGHQISSARLSPELQGISSFPSYHPYSRLQAWCIYDIIYHYAPFLLRNPMVTFSGPNSTFSKSRSQISTPISKED
ncbi:hypothetical protein O181_077296 [Austropuccinia psidii MF-1]|uniref:Uncharacterized protein n=1 Tax=Austropuccinia psidii MF-1 TaxID=1389203 RepID=A0A9Q3IBZ0_9BASI|nr:hypothetical protein [Austropuccinia psidii MF-1]